jgi:hypothetical protein
MKRVRAEPVADTTPRYALAWAMLACAIAALTLAYPALTGGFLVNPRSDQYIAGWAFREYGAETLRTTGGFPLWNPYQFGGMPYIDAMHGDIFYPTFLLRMILPTDVAMTWGMILHFWLAGVAAYAFFRAHRVSFGASLIGGLAYMMSGQVAGLVSPGHDGKLFITALLPVSLLMVRYGIRDGRKWAWGALAIVVGLGVLTPHPQLLQYMLLACGAYALWTAFFEGGDDAPPRNVAVKRLAASLGSIALGMAIGALQYLPLRQYTPWSPRSAGHDWETAVSFSMPPEETFNWVFPQFSGILDDYWGRNGIHFHSEYLGFPVLILAAIAFATAAGPKRRLMWFATGMLAISWLWSMGGFTPFYKLVAAIVPGTMYFRAPSTIMFQTAFAIALLAALGAERVFAGAISKKVLIGGGIALGVFTLLGVSGALSAGVLDAVRDQLRDPERSEALLDQNRGTETAGAIRLLLVGAAALFLVWSISAGRMARNVALLALAGLVVLDLWSIERKYWLFSPRAAQMFGSDAITERIRTDSLYGRAFAFDVPAANLVPRDPFLGGTALMGVGVRQVAGYHGNELGRYQRLYYESGVATPRTLEDFVKGFAAIGRLTNLRWFYTNIGDLPAPFEKVLGPVKNGVGSETFLYRVPGNYSQAWVVPAMMKLEDDRTLATLLQGDVSQSIALFDPAATVEAQNISALPAPLAINARTTKYAPGLIDVELDAPAPAKSALLVAENFYPGWKATVDGQPVEVSRANYVIMGVPLPAGARKIELRFTNAAYEKGKTITFIALGLSLLLAIGGVVMERKTARA